VKIDLLIPRITQPFLAVALVMARLRAPRFGPFWPWT